MSTGIGAGAPGWKRLRASNIPIRILLCRESLKALSSEPWMAFPTQDSRNVDVSDLDKFKRIEK